MAALAEPQVMARNMVVEVEHPEGDRVLMPGNPIKLSDVSADSFTASPGLGQHNQEIFGDLLGKSKSELSILRDEGAI